MIGSVNTKLRDYVFSKLNATVTVNFGEIGPLVLYLITVNVAD